MLGGGSNGVSEGTLVIRGLMECVVGKGKLKCCQGVGGMGGVLLHVWGRGVTEDGDCDAAGGEELGILEELGKVLEFWEGGAWQRV